MRKEINTSKKIAERIGQLRYNYEEKNNKKLSQKEIAKTIGIRQQNYAEIENGREGRYLKHSQIIKLSEFYGVSADYILGLIDEPSVKISDKKIFKEYGLESNTLNVLEKNRNNFTFISTLNRLIEDYEINGDKSVLSNIDMFLNFISWGDIKIYFANENVDTKEADVIYRTITRKQQSLLEESIFTDLRMGLLQIKNNPGKPYEGTFSKKGIKNIEVKMMDKNEKRGGDENEYSRRKKKSEI